jgi:hypothetical protein
VVNSTEAYTCITNDKTFPLNSLRALQQFHAKKKHTFHFHLMARLHCRGFLLVDRSYLGDGGEPCKGHNKSLLQRKLNLLAYKFSSSKTHNSPQLTLLGRTNIATKTWL